MTTPYGQGALTGELRKLARAVPGERNHTLNTTWFKIAQLIEAGHVDRADAKERFAYTAEKIGLSKSEIRATMNSGTRAAQPRSNAPATGPTGFDQPNRDTSQPVPKQEAAPAPLPPVAGLSEAFWNARPAFKHIRQAAHARGRSAEAVLGVVLARVAANTPHFVKLPPIVGAKCGLSLIIALTGPPGSGKTSSKAIATELIPREAVLKPECDDIPPGSGEGLIEILFEQVEDDQGKKVKQQTRHNVFTYADEGEILAVQARRNSSNTILPIIRSVFTDSTLGQTNASAERKRIVRGGKYAFGIVLGIQPEKAGLLFDDAGGGTPQRFLWMPTDTPTPPPADRPDWPGPLDTRRLEPGFTDPDGYKYLTVPDDIRTEIQAADHQRQTNGCDPLDEHADLIRLKTAGVLAVLDGRNDITLEDWQLAEVIRDLSAATRDRALATIARTNARRNQERGEAEAGRAIIVDTKRAEAATSRINRSIMRKLDKLDDGEWIPEGKLRAYTTTGDDRAAFADAIETLIDSGLVDQKPTGRTREFKRKGATP